ncbi:MAG: hypothetical protein GY932_00840 [Arcobacter sp.]|nr:hypothetical protein [Arcobacter sp.]
MLPKLFDEWHPATYRPLNRSDKAIQDYFKRMIKQGVSQKFLDSEIITEKEAINILERLNINKNTAFYEFYITFKGIDSSEQEEADLMYSLDEIYEDYKNPFWADKYPNIQEKYLQISSIEGHGSYFYDKKTDAVYDVHWGEMDDLITGKLKPWFTSFYDFLEWYYLEEDEDTQEENQSPKTKTEETINLKELSTIIPWAGLKTIEDYNEFLTNICKDEGFKEYEYLFEDIEFSANDEKLKYTKLPTTLVSTILDNLGMVMFYRANDKIISSLSYEKDENAPRLSNQWSQYIRENGFESVENYRADDETIIKTSKVLIKYGYETVERIYERTQVNLEEE